MSGNAGEAKFFHDGAATVLREGNIIHTDFSILLVKLETGGHIYLINTFSSFSLSFLFFFPHRLSFHLALNGCRYRQCAHFYTSNLS